MAEIALGTRPWPMRSRRPPKASGSERIANAIFFGEDDKVLPGVVPIPIRGRELPTENNVHTLRVNLGDSAETMNWFLKDVWNDLQTAPAPLAGQ